MYPILFRIFGFEIRAYGVMIAIAAIAGTILGAREAKRRGLNPDLVYDFVFYAILAAIIGSRIYYVLFFDPAYFIKNPLEMFAIWKGGLAIHGGLIAGLLTAIWFTKKHGLSFWFFTDTVTPSVILGQAIGRGACTMNGCSYGKPTNLPWAITFTNPDAAAPLGIPLHPTQIYELILDLAIFAMVFLLRKKIKFNGQLFLIYGMAYGIARFIVEGFRGDQLTIGGYISTAQTISIVIFIISLMLYLYLKKGGATISSKGSLKKKKASVH
jgi:phosphatidylglycerol:prolipoprotein diacylglycerol transferase